jgi:hypothetical protein
MKCTVLFEKSEKRKKKCNLLRRERLQCIIIGSWLEPKAEMDSL